MTLYGGVEMGGTKCVCALGTAPDDLGEEVRFATTTPTETIARIIAYFQSAPVPLTGIGIASFGPVDPRRRSAAFGTILTTPKPGWANVQLVDPIRQELGVPVGFDTDVNGAALAEYHWGAARGLDTFVYMTVGTGIGGGVLVNGIPLHGLLHPEMGHIRVPHDRQRDPFPGTCPYHGDCLEGLAAGPAIHQRWNQPAETLPADHPGWSLEAHYLALAVVNYIAVLSPQRVIMGGGVMEQVHLFPRIRSEVRDLLNGYIQVPELLERIDEMIVPPALGRQAGVLGAIALAREAAD